MVRGGHVSKPLGQLLGTRDFHKPQGLLVGPHPNLEPGHQDPGICNGRQWPPEVLEGHQGGCSISSVLLYPLALFVGRVRSGCLCPGCHGFGGQG